MSSNSEEEIYKNDPILQKLRASHSKEFLTNFRRFSRCLLDPDLLATKAFCLFLYGACGALLPYLPLYFKQFGLNAWQVGLIIGIGPIIQCLSYPAWAAVANKWRIGKFIFLTGILSWLVKALLVLAVHPRAQICIQTYQNSTSNLTYRQSYHLWQNKPDLERKWHVVMPNSIPKPTQHSTTVKLHTTVKSKNSTTSGTTVKHTTVKSESPTTVKHTTVKSESPTTVKHTTVKSESPTTVKHTTVKSESPTTVKHTTAKSKNSSNSAGLFSNPQRKRTVLEDLDEAQKDLDEIQKDTWLDKWLEFEENYETYKTRRLKEFPNELLIAQADQVLYKRHLKVKYNRDQLNPQVNETVHNVIQIDPNELNNLVLIFVLFFIIGDFLMGPTFTLADASVLNRLDEDHRESPTGMRASGCIGWIITVLVVGTIIYDSVYIVCGDSRSLYYVAFYFFLGFVCMAFVNSLWFKFTYEDDRGSGGLLQVISLFATRVDAAFLVCVLYVGLCYGFLSHFLNWYIDDLGGNTLMMGCASAARELIALVFFLFGECWLPVLGHVKVLLMSLLCYTACFFSFWGLSGSLWLVVAISVLEGATFASLWRCCERYFGHLGAPLKISGTTQNFLQAIFWGLGNGGGAIGGGALYHKVGAKKAFLTLGVSSLIVCLLFLLICYIDRQLKDLDEAAGSDSESESFDSAVKRH